MIFVWATCSAGIAKSPPWPPDLAIQRERLAETKTNAAGVGRCDQHYQNFCGFESIADAQRYLAVFERLYRFTPFSQAFSLPVAGRSRHNPLHLIGPGDNWRATTSASCP